MSFELEQLKKDILNLQGAIRSLQGKGERQDMFISELVSMIRSLTNTRFDPMVDKMEEHLDKFKKDDGLNQ